MIYWNDQITFAIGDAICSKFDSAQYPTNTRIDIDEVLYQIAIGVFNDHT